MTSGYAIVTLLAFIISVLFVIHPVSIPMPRPIPQIPINLTTAPIIAIALLWAAQCLDPSVVRNGVIGTEGVKPFNILILFFSLAYMATTLDITGVLKAAAYWVSNKSGQNGWKLYLYFYILLTFLSILLGNDPVIITGTAFLVYYTEASRLDWRAWIMAEFAVTSTSSMVLFTGNPTNVVVCEGFGINCAAFTAYTILPFLACSLSCFFTMVFQYKNDVRRRLTRDIHEDPWSALLDPIGACVGRIMLGTTLSICLLVSFFRIDAWMISLPFAVLKLFFDVGWDHYRYSRGIPMLGRKPPKDIEMATDGSTIDSNQRVDPTAPATSPREASIVESCSKTPDMEPSIEFVNGSQRVDTTASSSSPPEAIVVASRSKIKPNTETQPPFTQNAGTGMLNVFRLGLDDMHDLLDRRFPTVTNALPRLPFALLPFAFCQFILVEALDRQGWVDVFASWLVRASDGQLHRPIWVVGIVGVLLSNFGTNIGATILLTKVVRAAALPYDANRGAAIALAVASNIGAVGFTFSASLGGLLWRSILGQKGIDMKPRDFALWNLLPLFAMTAVGLGVVSAEMAVLFGRDRLNGVRGV